MASTSPSSSSSTSRENSFFQEALHDLRNRLDSLTPQGVGQSTDADVQNAAEQEKKTVLEQFLIKLSHLEPLVICKLVRDFGTEADALIQQCLVRIQQEKESVPSPSSSSLRNDMLTEAIHEFRQRVQLQIPVDLGHLTVHEEVEIEEVTKQEKSNVWKEFMGKLIDQENSDEDKVCGFIKGFHPGIQELIEEYKTKNRENRNQHETLMEERIDKLCSYLKTSMEEKLLLAPQMDVTVLESNIENGKLKALELFSYWDHGNVKLYEEKVERLNEKMNQIGRELLERQRRHLQTTGNLAPAQQQNQVGREDKSGFQVKRRLKMEIPMSSSDEESDSEDSREQFDSDYDIPETPSPQSMAKTSCPEPTPQLKRAVVRLTRVEEDKTVESASSSKNVNDSSEPELELGCSSSSSESQPRISGTEKWGAKKSQISQEERLPPLQAKLKAFKAARTTMTTAPTPKPTHSSTARGKRLFLDESDDDDEIQVIAEMPPKLPRLSGQSQNATVSSEAASTAPTVATKVNGNDPVLIFRLSTDYISMGSKIGDCFIFMNLCNSNSRKGIPPVIGIASNGRLLYGADAISCPHHWSLLDLLRESSSLPKTISFKISESEEEKVEHKLNLEFLLGILLKTMKQSAESPLKWRKTFSSAIITVPLWLSSVHRTQIKHAGKIAGFSEIHLLNQETVAAYANCSRKPVRSGPARKDIFVLSESFGIVSAIQYRYCRISKTLAMIEDEFLLEDGNMEDPILRKEAISQLFGGDKGRKTVLILGGDSSKWRESFRNACAELGYGYDDSMKEDDLLSGACEVYSGGTGTLSEYQPHRLSLRRRGFDSRSDYPKLDRESHASAKFKLPKQVRGDIPKLLVMNSRKHRFFQENLLTREMIQLGELVIKKKFSPDYPRIVSFQVDLEGIVSLEGVNIMSKLDKRKIFYQLKEGEFSWTVPNLNEEQVEDVKSFVQHVLQERKKKKQVQAGSSRTIFGG